MTDRLRTFIAEHRRLTTAVVVASALVLLVVAGFLASTILRPSSGIGRADPSPSALPTNEEASPAASAAPASPTAQAEEPRATPTMPPRSEFPLVTPAAHPPLPPSWGVVAVNGLNVRSGPGEEHPVVGTLNEGDLVRVIEGSNWVEILADGVHGWALAMPGDSPDDGFWIHAVPTPFSWTDLAGVASNGQTYVAYGTSAELDYPPYEGGFEQPLFLFSADGSTWAESHDGVPGRVVDVAGGPGGFVAIGYHGYGGAATAFSSDGATWAEPTGLPGQQHAVAYGPAGWVIVGNDYESGSFALRSDDGRSWDEPTDVPGTSSNVELEASAAGYVTFDRFSNEAFASTDGETWQEIGLDAAFGDWIADVELVDERIFVVVVDARGISTVLRGTLGPNGTVSWAAPVDGSAFAGARVDSISSGGSGLLALGWDSDALVPAAWTSADGSAWARTDVAADAFGGEINAEPAWGNGGWVGVGNGTERPALWRSTDGASWSLAAEVEARSVEGPGCPIVDEASVLFLMFLGGDAYDCFADASLTLRGWVPLIDGLGGCCTPDRQPSWLAGEYPANWLVSGEADVMGLPVYVPPGVDASALEPRAWVEVVGHFGDPAAEACSSTPTPGFPHRLESQVLFRDSCARRFVVDTVRPVDAP